MHGDEFGAGAAGGPQGFETLASAFRALKLKDELIREVLGPIAQTPELEAPWVEAAVKLRRRGYHRAAEETYEAALHRFPNSARLWGNRGVLFRNQGDYEQAIKSLNRALALKPDYGFALYNLGNTYELAQQFDSAIEWYAKAVEADGPKPAAWNGLGNCYGATAQYDKAVDCYHRAIELDLNYGEPHFNLAALLAKTGKRREAIAKLTLFLHKWPDDEQAQSLLATLKDASRDVPTIGNAQQPDTNPLIVRSLDNVDNDGRIVPLASASPAHQATKPIPFGALAEMTRDEAAQHGLLGARSRVELWNLVHEIATKTEPPKHPRLFLSYRRGLPEHMEWVRRVALELDQRGYDVILDQFIQGQSNAPSVPELASLIATCNVFVPVLTDDYFERIDVGDGPVLAHAYDEDGWVFDEFQAALRIGQMKRLVITGVWRSGRLHKPFTPDNVIDMRDDLRFEDALAGPFPRRSVRVLAVRSATRIRSIGPMAYSKAHKVQRELADTAEYEQVLVVNELAE